MGLHISVFETSHWCSGWFRFPYLHKVRLKLICSLQIINCPSFLSDFDECSSEPNPCDDNADCTNSDGSYSCTCKKGFTGNGTVCEGMCQGIVNTSSQRKLNLKTRLGTLQRKKNRKHVFTQQNSSNMNSKVVINSGFNGSRRQIVRCSSSALFSDLGPVHTSCFCRAERNSEIKFYKSTAEARRLNQTFELSSALN